MLPSRNAGGFTFLHPHMQSTVVVTCTGAALR